MNPYKLPPYFDLRILDHVAKHGGRATVRQLSRRFASCQPVEAARARVAEMVQARLGIWDFQRPGRRGGKPSPAFKLTAPPEVVAGLTSELQMPQLALSPPSKMQVAREIVAFLNRYQAMTCAELGEVLAEAAAVLLAVKPIRDLPAPYFHRHLQVGRSGLKITWNFMSQ